jgi:TRAP transporter TAXI family solute receptor
VLVALLAVAGGVWQVTRPTTLIVAVGPADGDDAHLMRSFAERLDRQGAPVRLVLRPTEDVTTAARALDAGDADLAVVRADVALPSAGQTIAILHRNAAVLMAPSGSAIEDAAGLNGKTVGIVPGTRANEDLLDAVLAQYDVPVHGVTRVGLAPDGVDEAVREKRVDAIFAVGAVTGKALAGAVAGLTEAGGGPPVFIGIDEAEAMAQRRIALESVTIVRGAFGGSPPRPDDSVTTVGTSYRLMASTAAPETEITELTRRLFETRAELTGVAAQAARIEAPDTDKGARLPVHPGAAAYLNNEEESFLDRYGDWFYILAMVFGFIASAAAAIAGRWRSRTQDQAHRLEELLGIMREARTASDVGSLDVLEQRADEVFATTLSVATSQQIDTGRLTAFSLALDQVRHAIADRRRTLAEAPARRHAAE